MLNRYNEYHQVKLAIISAEKLVGQATMEMNESQLQNVEKALLDARKQLDKAKLTEINSNDLYDTKPLMNRLS